VLQEEHLYLLVVLESDALPNGKLIRVTNLASEPHWQEIDLLRGSFL